MSNHFPITPPPELVQQWAAEARSETFATQHLCNQAARWGADQELEACANYIDNNMSGNKAREFRAIRRPKPPSLKARAIGALAALEINEPGYEGTYDAIRRAIEQLPD